MGLDANFVVTEIQEAMAAHPPTATHFTCVEGGYWMRWTFPPLTGGCLLPHGAWRGLPLNLAYDGGAVFLRVHALRFTTGAEWDVVNGWRPEDLWTMTMEHNRHLL